MTRAEALRLFVAGTDVKVEYVEDSDFVDDHIVGCSILLGEAKTKVCLPWLGSRGLAAAMYASTSEKSYKDLQKIVHTQYVEDMDDEEIEEMTEAM